jgi:hypothetical protein
VPQLRSWRVSVFRNYLVIVKVVDHHVAPDGTEEYSIEVFNALGDTIAVTAVPATALEPHSGVR